MPKAKSENKYFAPVYIPEEFWVSDGCGFMDPKYERITGSMHTGIDLNKMTGGNSDLNWPLVAVTDCIVDQIGYYPAWGNVVVFYCPGPGVWMQYAHMEKLEKSIKKGAQIRAGQRIGTIGRGDKNRYLAHLHFEIRLNNIPADIWPSSIFREKGRQYVDNFIRDNYANPVTFLAKNGIKLRMQ